MVGVVVVQIAHRHLEKQAAVAAVSTVAVSIAAGAEASFVRRQLCIRSIRKTCRLLPSSAHS